MAPEKQIREYDVVVVGAGNAGLIAAISLHKALGTACLIVDIA